MHVSVAADASVSAERYEVEGVGVASLSAFDEVVLGASNEDLCLAHHFEWVCRMAAVTAADLAFLSFSSSLSCFQFLKVRLSAMRIATVVMRPK